MRDRVKGLNNIGEKISDNTFNIGFKHRESKLLRFGFFLTNLTHMTGFLLAYQRTCKFTKHRKHKYLMIIHQAKPAKTACQHRTIMNPYLEELLVLVEPLTEQRTFARLWGKSDLRSDVTSKARLSSRALVTCSRLDSSLIIANPHIMKFSRINNRRICQST